LEEEKKEHIFNDIMGKITIPIEKLEKLFEKLYPQAPNENTQIMISSIVIAALAMSDPIGYLQDKLTHYNRQYCSDKMINYGQILQY
jgi:hypothetical protein